jgi:hypothetical protein
MIKNKLQFYGALVVMIVLFDVAASFWSKSFGFDYSGLAVVSLILYFIAGFLGCRFDGLSGGVLAGLVAGLADSTLGWWLSSLIKPNIQFEQPVYTLPLITEIVFIVTAEATLVGLIGAVCYFGINRLWSKKS